MRPHHRIRKTIKWTGAAVTVLLVVVWIGSGWVLPTWRCRAGVELNLRNGLLDIDVVQVRFPAEDCGFVFQGYNSEFVLDWWFHMNRYAGSAAYQIPIWAFVVPALAVTACAWRLDTLARRRARINHCPKCNYNRAGLGAGAVCPECGSAGVSA